MCLGRQVADAVDRQDILRTGGKYDDEILMARFAATVICRLEALNIEGGG